MTKWATIRSWGHHTLVYWWIATTLADLIVPITGYTALVLIASVTTSVLLIVSATAGLRHDFHLCFWCVRQTPDNPQLAVEQDMSWLRTFHRWIDIPARYDMLILLTLLGILILGFIVLEIPYNRLFALPLDLWNVGLLWMLRKHRLLAPWCPYCRRGFWEDTGIPEHDPDPTMKKVT